MKLKFHLDGRLSLNKTIEVSSMVIVAKVIFMKLTNIINKFSSMIVCIKYKNEEQK